MHGKHTCCSCVVVGGELGFDQSSGKACRHTGISHKMGFNASIAERTPLLCAGNLHTEQTQVT